MAVGEESLVGERSMLADEFLLEFGKIFTRIVGFAIAIIIVGYMLHALGLIDMRMFVTTFIDKDLIASMIVR